MPPPKDGSPTAATKPKAPDKAKDADDAKAGSSTDPISGSNSKSGAGSSTQVPPKTHDANSEENKKKVSWIGLELVYESNGKPVVGMPYEVTLPDGKTISGGSTDDKGRARVDGIDPGSCQISFPTLDKEAWVDA